ncbi:MAG: hypothetical protein Kow0029_15510 [Candidatus Rifleibacteriota bacterium]
MNSTKKISIIFLLVMIPFCAFAAESADKVFAGFLAGLDAKSLENGSYIKNSTDFYSLLLENKIDTSSARIVLLVSPEPVSKSLSPDESWLSLPLAEPWPYHSFVSYQGKAYDPNFKEKVREIKDYFRKLWQYGTKDQHINVYSFQLRHVPQFMGTLNGKTPKLQSFEPVTIEFFINNPHHISKRKKHR